MGAKPTTEKSSKVIISRLLFAAAGNGHSSFISIGLTNGTTYNSYFMVKQE